MTKFVRRELGDVITDMVAATSIDEVWALFCQAMITRKFDKMIYGGTRFPERGFLGEIEKALILHYGPQEYADVYIGEELYLKSPSYAWAEVNRGFASFPQAARAMLTTTPVNRLFDVARIAMLNRRFGVTSGFVGSMNGVVPGMNGVIGIGAVTGITQSEADRIWEQDGKEIEALCKTMHLRVANLPQNGLLRPLTTRQREVLEWYSLGKTTQDIAVILDLSAATVEKHMKCARDVLDASTTAHAVKKAMSLNLLTA